MNADEMIAHAQTHCQNTHFVRWLRSDCNWFITDNLLTSLVDRTFPSYTVDMQPIGKSARALRCQLAVCAMRAWRVRQDPYEVAKVAVLYEMTWQQLQHEIETNPTRYFNDPRNLTGRDTTVEEYLAAKRAEQLYEPA